MTVYISLLRGINVGGKRMKMADLRQVYTDLGLSDVKTILASGNVIFRSTETDQDKLSQTLEAAIAEHFGFESRIILRTPNTIAEAAKNNPFAEHSNFEAKKLLVFFLKDMPQDDALNSLRAAHDGVEQVQLVGQDLFAYYPEGMGRSKLDNKLLEKHMGVVGTGRNWNTVNKLLALSDSY